MQTVSRGCKSTPVLSPFLPVYLSLSSLYLFSWVCLPLYCLGETLTLSSAAVYVLLFLEITGRVRGAVRD